MIKFSPAQNYRRGFTLIELLVVIAILGVLAAAVLLAINPAEQLARGRDAGRLSTIDQLGHAVEAYYTVQNSFPAVGAAWVTTLQTAGELKIIPANPTGPAYTTPTCTNAQGGYCYNVNATPEAVVYTPAESSSEKSKCASGTAYLTWSSAAGRTGVDCPASGEPQPGDTTLK